MNCHNDCLGEVLSIGMGNNIERDKALHYQGIGANKTTSAIVTASKAAPGVHRIKTNFDFITKVDPQSNTHSTRNSRDDKMLMLKDLHEMQPFQLRPNRSHQHFPDIQLLPLIGLDMEKFFTWLEKNKKQISMGERYTVQTCQPLFVFIFLKNA